MSGFDKLSQSKPEVVGAQKEEQVQVSDLKELANKLRQKHTNAEGIYNREAALAEAELVLKNIGLVVKAEFGEIATKTVDELENAHSRERWETVRKIPRIIW